MSTEIWWKECVVYQIYLRSFQDSNGDGIGDLQGIIRRLGYLNELGIGCIWLSPVYPSPNKDFGYDVSDYCAIHEDFGTMDDMDELLEKAHALGIKVILDMVLNHTSIQHPWFIESRKGGESNPYKDYYLWVREPNNWMACFGGGAFTWDECRREFYMHSFLPQQPDLNWRNPATVEDIFKQCRFWLDKGIDGFRLDVINCIIKDENLRFNPRVGGLRHLRPYDRQIHVFDRNRPETHRRLQDFRKMVDQYPDRMLVGEIMVESPGEPEMASSYLGDELNLTFDFSLLQARFNASLWGKVAKRWYAAVGNENWPTWVLNNHDVHRSISRFKGNERKARLSAMFIMTQKGTPFIYYGEELGMPDSSVSHKEMVDPLGKHYYPLPVGRDSERNPMLWDMSTGFGFSDTKPWIPYAPEGCTHSVAYEEKFKNSMLSYYKQLIALRKKDNVILYGEIEFVEMKEKSILAYYRILETGKRLVLLNFSRKSVSLILPDAGATPLLSSFGQVVIDKGKVTLSGFQAAVFKV